jgi:branched-chain amino acid transport system permease protein
VALAAVAIGTLEQGVAWDQPSQPTLVLAVIAAVVLGGILLRQFAWQRRGRVQVGQWALASGVREIPASLRRLVEVRVGSVGGAVGLLLFMVTLPAWMGPGSLLEVSTLLVLAIVGCSIVVLTGWAGQVSLGQMSFAAVGAVAGAAAMLDWHWDLSLALLFAGAAAAVVAVVVGIPALRLDGTFVAVTTLAFGLAASGYFLDRTEFSWIPNTALRTPAIFGAQVVTQTEVLYTCLGVALLVVLGMHGLRQSRFGRVLRAISTNERAVAAYGVTVDRAKLLAFAVSGFIAGIAGCLLVLVNQQYVETSFTVTQSLAVFTATAVGGLGSVVGAVVGAALVEGSSVFLPPSWQLFPSAFGVLIVLLAFPGGVSNLLYSARDSLVGVVVRRHQENLGNA